MDLKVEIMADPRNQSFTFERGLEPLCFWSGKMSDFNYWASARLKR